MAEYKVDGLDALMALVRKHEHERRETLDSAIIEAAAAGQALLTMKAPKATGDLQQSFHLEDGGHSVVADAPYAAAVEVGVRPGHFPNLDGLKDWVKKKLRVSADEVDHVAYLIGMKIFREGIQPTWFVKGNIEKMAEILKRIVTARLKKA